MLAKHKLQPVRTVDADMASGVTDVRDQLCAAAAASGRSLTWLSVLIGREPSFLPAFVEQGRPAELDAVDRRHLAIYLEVDERRLVGVPPHG